MAKVRCKFCKFEKDQKCGVKKNMTVKVNKKRACPNYQGDEGKIVAFVERKQISSKPQSTTRPDWWWDRKARKAERDRLVNEEMKQYQTTASPDSKHPLTGDLSRFTGPKPNETVAG
jgi:hypothetical protein